MTKSVNGCHIIRFGTAPDQKFLLGDYLAGYDELILNSNSVAHMPNALSTFLSQKAHNKPYLVDPLTHAFQHDTQYIESNSKNREGEIKKSLGKLATAFGAPIEKAILKDHRSLVPADFEGSPVLSRFCNRVLDFQLKKLPSVTTKSDVAKYYRFKANKKGETFADRIFAPTVLVAPYFYLAGSSFNNWLDVNLRCAENAKEICQKKRKPLGLQLVLSQDVLLSPGMRKKICSGYGSIAPDLVLLWVDNFDEHEVSQSHLESFVNLLQELSHFSSVINLYGSFFSVILSRCGIVKNLIGVSHGLEYGEMRGVVPVGGGMPKAKYYLPRLHKRLDFIDAVRAVRALGGLKSANEFHENVCNCRICQSVISDAPESEFEAFSKGKSKTFTRNGQRVTQEFPLRETRDLTVAHYLQCKREEYRNQISLSNVLSELANVHEQLRAAGIPKEIGHCLRWSKVFEKCK